MALRREIDFDIDIDIMNGVGVMWVDSGGKKCGCLRSTRSPCDGAISRICSSIVMRFSSHVRSQFFRWRRCRRKTKRAVELDPPPASREPSRANVL